MAWSTRAKNISVILPTTPHAPLLPNIVGRAPGLSTFAFTPSDFFGAAARCLHLHVINPALATPESQVISALVEQHVDDMSNDFAVLSTANRFKDYAKSYFSGTVAAGIAYLMMVRDGYVWTDHFENEKKSGPGTGCPAATRSPDYVFARSGQSGVALMESKGTRSDTSSAFDHTVEDGYTGQVEPHLGYAIGTSLATHGYSIGAWMTSTTKAELTIHHTDLVAAPVSPTIGPGSIASVQQGNYATALQLSHGSRLGGQVRAGRVEDELIPFVEFSWLDHEWLSWHPRLRLRDFVSFTPEGLGIYWRGSNWPNEAWPYFGRYLFATEKRVTEQVLWALSRGVEPSEVRFDLNPMQPGLEARAREVGSTVFPDGLAVISNRIEPASTRMVVWQRKAGKFVAL